MPLLAKNHVVDVLKHAGFSDLVLKSGMKDRCILSTVYLTFLLVKRCTNGSKQRTVNSRPPDLHCMLIYPSKRSVI
jgi:hypothetical protein